MSYYTRDGLATESEGAKYGLLDNRIRMIKAHAGALILHAENIAKSRISDGQ